VHDDGQFRGGVCGALQPFHFAIIDFLWLVALVPVLAVALCRVLLRVPYGEAMLVPLVGGCAMTVAILVSARAGLLCGFVISLLCAITAREDSATFVAVLLSASVGVMAVSEIASRMHLVRAAVLLALTNAVLSAALGALREVPADELWRTALFSGAVGVASVVVAAGLVMFLERPLGVTTHLSLLELSSPDEPVMRRMQSEAPGTYTHSLMVAQLSEAGAKAVGADPLLCRVGGLYHDVGKLRRPHCFIENQSGANVHDRLSPQLSALLIIAHVHDGLELGRALKLPQPVHDIIAQHHGRDLVAFFYHRAMQGAQDAGQLPPDEHLFRYPGPRPQSKEAAVVMLADAVEASSRSLPDVTPEKLDEHIKTMIEGRLRAGELDECELTLRDLGTIERAFAHVLRGALHQRIEYPDPSRELQDKNDGRSWTREAMRDPQEAVSRRRTLRGQHDSGARQGTMKRIGVQANRSTGDDALRPPLNFGNVFGCRAYCAKPR
jgi:putative nucleotidyltransferase with HDIG domain